MNIIATLVEACKFIKTSYYKNMIITPKPVNIQNTRHSVIRRLLLYLFINLLCSLFKFSMEQTTSKVFTLKKRKIKKIKADCKKRDAWIKNFLIDKFLCTKTIRRFMSLKHEHIFICNRNHQSRKN